ncbi:DUF4832 domain-containing protein [Uliginosibacterium sp. 31-16]|uniref:DUF4832 domain-containing protein n=1 Tax=Uliginosibacterium sp. 31-16 TaxID=3068315 RepID=UPI00273E5381|nr:DUF4832 domain-containing protein [Uliginosibacterium sp. 31-16]MDP5239325.1 DUF4832 domain-containing protein [Uliginosibacterium sp. 31-16]
MFKSLAIVLSACLLCLAATAAEPLWQTQVHAPAPVDNPLKGLVPYAGAANPDGFPHSMEFSYFPLSAVLKAPGRYDWTVLERFLDQVAGRGHQAVLRFHVEYPGKTGSLPPYLLDAGVGLTRWQRASTPPRPPVDNETPDYANPVLRRALTDFIAAFGARYDGDPRIGFITAGLLGLWGEWHNHPRTELFADKALQAAVMDAYAQAFRKTAVLLRYPAGEADPVYVANAGSRFGFHDDSFAWNTLATKPHYFVAKLQAAGALDAWQTRPIGGEIRPEAWGKVFDAEPGLAALQDFAQCVEATHVSWLMDSGMFKAGNSLERRERAIAQVRRMGYEFHVTQVALVQQAEQLTVKLQIENRGVAPFYYPWSLKGVLLDSSGKLVREARGTGVLAGILPQAAPAAREQVFDLAGLPAGTYRVLLQGENPLPKGQPVRFANARQDADQTGWLTLGAIVR